MTENAGNDHGGEPLLEWMQRRYQAADLDQQQFHDSSHPLVGAMIAVAFERIPRGAPTRSGAAAQGILRPDDPAAL